MMAIILPTPAVFWEPLRPQRAIQAVLFPLSQKHLPTKDVELAKARESHEVSKQYTRRWERVAGIRCGRATWTSSERSEWTDRSAQARREARTSLLFAFQRGLPLTTWNVSSPHCACTFLAPVVGLDPLGRRHIQGNGGDTLIRGSGLNPATGLCGVC